MTTNTTNNLKVCYLIVVVPQCTYLQYKYSWPFSFQGRKRRKKVKIRLRKKKKKGEDIASHLWSAPHSLRGATPVASRRGEPRRALSGLF